MKRGTAKKGGAKKKKPAAKLGRPSKFTVELADEICRRMFESEGDNLPESLRQICRDENMPARSTVHRWLSDEPEFQDRYARARELRKDAIIDRLLWLSAEVKKHAVGSPGTGEAGARVAAYKIEIDSLKWILSKEYPRQYGDKVTTEISGPEGKPIKSETSHRVSDELQDLILQRTAEAARIAANVMPPASFRGENEE